jgi:hypothetical protein
MLTRHEMIDAHAESCQVEIKRKTAEVMRQIKRMAEYPARSAGQKRRYQKLKTQTGNLK